jgi:hypothetical protein
MPPLTNMVREELSPSDSRAMRELGAARVAGVSGSAAFEAAQGAFRER